MIPVNSLNVFQGQTELNGKRQSVNEFASVFTDALGCEEFTRFPICPDLHVAIVGLHENGFSMVVERVIGTDDIISLFAEFVFLRADTADLWVGEDDVERTAVVHGLRRLSEGVESSGLTLFDRRMDHSIGASHVAGSVDFRIGGNQKGVFLNQAVFLNRDSRLIEAEAS